jgi:hypothetical protein
MLPETREETIFFLLILGDFSSSYFTTGQLGLVVLPF